MKNNKNNKTRVTTALLLAAGSGSRLFPLTRDEPKCLTMVNGESILKRLVSNLRTHGFKRLVIVTGYLENRIRQTLGKSCGKLKIEYVHSPRYKTTNNIYSLWKARKLLNEPFVLFESDLVFDESLLTEMVYPNRIAVASKESWMDGTCVTLTDAGEVKGFVLGNTDMPEQKTYKTVNIYSLSRDSWSIVSQRLDDAISAGDVNEYYETVFSDLIEEGTLSFSNISFDKKPWYEIDSIEDLKVAERLFPTVNNEASVGPRKRIPALEVLNTASINDAISGT